MKRIGQVLVIVDKPKHTQVALARALALQRVSGAHLHLVAFAHHPMVDQKDTFDASQRGAVRREILRERTEWLRGQVRDAGAAAADVTLETAWTKDIPGWVSERLTQSPVDLVLKSRHRSESLGHTPTDWGLLRTCPAPVLLCVRATWPAKPRLLAALDLHRDDRAHVALNRRVLAASARVASLFGGSVSCVYAVEVSRVAGDLDLIDARAAARKARAEAQARLGPLLAGYEVPATRVHMPIGKVGHAVDDVAAKIGADVLVMGTTARKGVAGFVLGNSAERVLSRTRCDVLVLKP